MENKIKMGDIVIHTLSKVTFRCENKKHERWMNMNPYYVKAPEGTKILNYSNRK
jgi:hypothetical protein